LAALGVFVVLAKSVELGSKLFFSKANYNMIGAIAVFGDMGRHEVMAK
jgi:hypothetical protein